MRRVEVVNETLGRRATVPESAVQHMPGWKLVDSTAPNPTESDSPPVTPTDAVDDGDDPSQED